MASNLDQLTKKDISHPPDELGLSRTTSEVPDTSGETQIEAENSSDVSEFDDGYGTDSDGSDTTSISSSIRNHIFENGRRYHKYRDGKYVMPNDESEQNREDLKHEMLVKLCGGRHHLAPIGNDPHNIIDLGTGTGIWAIDMADEYPSAIVTGVDLSPIQPGWVPPNVKFVVDDFNDDWGFPQNHFDLVHLRNIIAHIRDIPQVFKQAYETTKPGGWIEIQEHENIPYCDDGTMPDNDPVNEFFTYVKQGMAVFGGDSTAILKTEDYLKKAGFIKITDTIYKIPVGPWARNKALKEIGLFMRAVLLDGLAAFSLRTLGTGLGWSPERREVALVNVRKALMDPKVHSYWPFHVITAQKPQE